MAYVELDLPDSLPDSVRVPIRKSVDPLFQDVHWLLATTIEQSGDTGPRRQLQIPTAHTLLATVAGFSTQFYSGGPGGAGTGARFKNCLTTFFPWDIDPPTGATSQEAAKILYDVFRNPLVHFLVMTEATGPTVKFGQVFRGTADAEKRVEELERLTGKPQSDPCLVVTPEKRVLWLDQFYWGVRKLVERWARNPNEVLHADQKFRLRPKR